MAVLSDEPLQNGLTDHRLMECSENRMVLVNYEIRIEKTLFLNKIA